MTIHEIRTPLAPAQVIGRARSFFALAGTPYAAFAEVVGDGFLKLHLEVGEIVIGASRQGDSTCVRGSASRGAHLLTRFLITLAPPLDAEQKTHRYRLPESRAEHGQVRSAPGSTSTRNSARAA